MKTSINQLCCWPRCKRQASSRHPAYGELCRKHLKVANEQKEQRIAQAFGIKHPVSNP
jgi:hypothetical protein